MSETDKELCDRILALTSTYGMTCSKEDARELATRLRGLASGQQGVTDILFGMRLLTEDEIDEWQNYLQEQHGSPAGCNVLCRMAKAALAASPQITENKLMAFYARYAMPMLAAPSCLVCGQSTQGQKPAIEHLALPSVVVCQSCAKSAAQPSDSVQGWQNIETAPKDGTRFLGLESVPVHNEDTGVSKIETNMCVCYHFAMFGIIPYPYTGKIVQGQEITHWMPLPEPPGGT